MKLLKIGQMAKLTNVSVQTLQYYEKIGLFFPVICDRSSNYRYYDINQASTIDTIKLLQSLGFSLKEIKVILHTYDEKILDEALSEKEAEFADSLRDIKRKRAILKQYQKSRLLYDLNKDKHSMEVLYFPKRKIVTSNLEENIYDMNDERYELHLRKFQKVLLEKNIPEVYFYNVGSIMEYNRIVNNDLKSDKLFVFIDNIDSFEEEEFLPEGMYMVLYCHTFDEEKVLLETMFASVKNNGYEIIGDYICEVVYEPPTVVGHTKSMFLRLQIPVRKIKYS